MQLSIRHTSLYQYEPDAAAAALRLIMTPPQTTAQNVIDWRVSVNDDPVVPLLRDAMGNNVALWHQHGQTGEIDVKAQGTITTTDVAGVLGGLSEATRPAMFLRKTPLTKPDARVEELALAAKGDGRLSQLHALSEEIHAAIDYRSGATTSKTTAAEAAAIGAGVCQDHAHVFISCCRVLEIPARYIAGYLFDADGELHSGNQTHAWAEAYVEGLGWVGFDVTNQLCPTDGYVRLAAGLDSDDAAIVRGVLSGHHEETLSVDVEIAQAQSQSQSQS